MNNAGRIALTALSCAGVIGVGIAVHYDTKKAEKKLKDLELEKAPLKDKIKATAPCYARSIIFSAATVGVIVANHSANGKTIATLTAAGSFSARLVTKYKEKIKEVFGEEKYEEVVNEVVKEMRDESENVETAKPYKIYSGGTMSSCRLEEIPNDAIFFDEYTEKPFESSLTSVYQALLHLNRNFRLCGCVDYSLFREFIGLEHDSEYDYVGWGKEFADAGYDWIDFEIIRDRSYKDGNHYILTPVFRPEVLFDYDRLTASYAHSEDENWTRMMTEHHQKELER